MSYAYKNDREKSIAKAKEWNKANKDRIHAWNKANPEKLKAYQKKYRAAREH